MYLFHLTNRPMNIYITFAIIQDQDKQQILRFENLVFLLREMTENKYIIKIYISVV